MKKNRVGWLIRGVTLLAPLFFSVTLIQAEEAQWEVLIKRLEENLSGQSGFFRLTMIVETKRTHRTLKMESYSLGHEKSFIKILHPIKDKGITFLKLDRAMWQYIPKIERTMKIPASMMLRSWMGSDFTNDDLVKESSLHEDYEVRALSSPKPGFYRFELLAKAFAPVVWHKILMTVQEAPLLPVSASYYDENGILVRTLQYENITNFNGLYYPARWVMTPKTADRQGHKTILIFDDVALNIAVDPVYFTKRALRRFSR